MLLRPGNMAISTDFDPQQRFFRETGVAAQIAAIVEPRIEALGFRLVRVSVSGRNGSTVQIMVERPDGGMSVGECEAVSRDVSPALDVDDPMSGRYHLEVSSPGIDRPLVRPADFDSWAGQVARIELSEPIEGRRRLRGRLEGLVEREVRIEVEDLPGQSGPTVLGLPVSAIVSAQLVLTDELIREDLRRGKRAESEEATGPHDESGGPGGARERTDVPDRG